MKYVAFVLALGVRLDESLVSESDMQTLGTNLCVNVARFKFEMIHWASWTFKVKYLH